MIDRTRCVLALAMLISPLDARAQQALHASPHAVNAPAVTPADGSSPQGAVPDAGMGFEDDLLAFWLGDDLSADSGELEGIVGDESD